MTILYFHYSEEDVPEDHLGGDFSRVVQDKLFTMHGIIVSEIHSIKLRESLDLDSNEYVATVAWATWLKDGQEITHAGDCTMDKSVLLNPRATDISNTEYLVERAVACIEACTTPEVQSDHEWSPAPSPPAARASLFTEHEPANRSPSPVDAASAANTSKR